jgi:lysylphosphatidylglycerol synthetase-like protein (DUF2156 family)
MIDGIIDFMLFSIVFPLAVLLFIVGGLMFLFSGANPNLATRGRSMMTAVVIGLVIIFVSWIAVNTVFNFIGISNTGPLSSLITNPGGWAQIICQ